MKIVVSLFVLFLLFSCGQKPKEEVLDMEDIIPQSDRYKEGVTTDPKKDTVDLGFDIWLADKSGIVVMEVDKHEEPMFVDRFQPKSMLKVDLTTKTETLFFGQWTFKDSLKTMNAFYNWIDCFGENCKSLKYLKETNFQSDPMLIFLNDTSITYISSASQLDEKKWQKYLSLKNKTALWDLVVVQKKQRKASWYSYAVDPANKKDTLFIKRKLVP
jgi:hypothetical protein